MKKKICIALSSILCFIFAVSCGPTGSTQSENQNSLQSNYQYDDYYAGMDLTERVGWLVNDGKSDYTIVIPENATEAENYAAMELQYYVEQSTGVLLPIVTDKGLSFSYSDSRFSIGRTRLLEGASLNTDYSQLNGDGFVIKTMGKTIITDAACDRGFQYAVFDFLEKNLNIRWFSYDETYIPTTDSVPVYKTDILDVPAFAMRNFINYYTHASSEYAWANHTRVNCKFQEMPEKYGGRPPFYGRSNGTHNANLYVPHDVYGESNPEFYKYIGGHSQWTLDWTSGVNDDGTLNEDMDGDGVKNEPVDDLSVARIAIEELKKDIVANPDIKYFSFEQEDGLSELYATNKTQAQKYGASGMAIRLVNILAREINEWAKTELNGREVYIVTFAYGPSSTAPVVFENGAYKPVDDTVIVDEHVIIRYALGAYRNYYSAFDEEKFDARDRQNTENWSLVCKDGNYMLWMYNSQFYDYLSYFPGTQRLWKDIKGATKYTTSYFVINACYNTYEWKTNMQSYIANKLMWNPDQDLMRLQEEYLRGYYGTAAAPYVQQMIDLFDVWWEAYMQVHDEEIDYLAVYSQMDPVLLQRAWELIETAETAVNNSTEINATRKSTLLKRLAGVKLCPKWMYFKSFENAFPNADESEFLAAASEAFALAEQAGVTRWKEWDSEVSGSIAAYKQSFGL